jgi:hypothetical protein
MTWIAAKLRALTYGSPIYKPGMVVYNRYGDATAKGVTLASFIGPDVGYSDDKTWTVTETWKTTDGSDVDVGYFWLPRP